MAKSSGKTKWLTASFFFKFFFLLTLTHSYPLINFLHFFLKWVFIYFFCSFLVFSSLDQSSCIPPRHYSRLDVRFTAFAQPSGARPYSFLFGLAACDKAIGPQSAISHYMCTSITYPENLSESKRGSGRDLTLAILLLCHCLFLSAAKLTYYSGVFYGLNKLIHALLTIRKSEERRTLNSIGRNRIAWSGFKR